MPCALSAPLAPISKVVMQCTTAANAAVAHCKTSQFILDNQPIDKLKTCKSLFESLFYAAAVSYISSARIVSQKRPVCKVRQTFLKPKYADTWVLSEDAHASF